MILRGLQRWKEAPWFSSQILLEDVRRRERKIRKCVCHSWGKTQSKWKKMETWSIRLTLVPKSQCLIEGVTWQNWCTLPKHFSALVLYRGFIPCVQPTRRANQEKLNLKAALNPKKGTRNIKQMQTSGTMSFFQEIFLILFQKLTLEYLKTHGWWEGSIRNPMRISNSRG